MDAEAYLGSLEPIGWKLGLERMHLLMSVLGFPQRRFASIHVVGTNGKSSVTRMAAALLDAHGVRAGAYVSPHVSRWSERVLIGGEPIGPDEFAAAVARTAEAAQVVERTLEEGEAVTQFEVATAAAFVALAAAGVKVAVIEAGLGGRLDATNVIPSQVAVLTSIGLEHTEWLGSTELEIAAEKLAVLRDHSTLVLGRVSPAVAALARDAAQERSATLVVAPEDPGSEVRLRSPGGFQRRNFSLASAAVEAFLGQVDEERLADVGRDLTIPGRLQQLGDDPPIYVDVAHNPDGAAAIAEALPEVAAGRPVVTCLAMLHEKDAAATVAALAPALDRVVCTELPEEALSKRGLRGAGSRPADELAKICETTGVAAEVQVDFAAAVRRGRELAAGAPGGLLLITGSHYVLAPARMALGLCED